MKALVTGATGYIGSKLCDRLLEEGWQVSAIVRKSGRRLAARWNGKVEPLHYDGTTESLMDGLAATTPQAVFHLASLVLAEHRPAHVTDLVVSNVLFGTQIAEACARSGVRNFVNTGTSWQHYRSEAYDPVCLYGATKQAFEDILDFYADAFGMKIATLKLFDTYGPDDPRPKLVNLLLKAARSGEDLGMSPGDQRLDLVHVDDVTNAFWQAARHLLDERTTAGHHRYAVSSGDSITLRQLAALVERIIGKKVNVTFGARPYRDREVMEPWQGGTPPPGWKPAHSLEKGLARLVTDVPSRKGMLHAYETRC